MSREEFKEMFLECLQEWSLTVSTEVEYGYDYGDTAYVRVKLIDPEGNTVLSDYGQINLLKEC